MTIKDGPDPDDGELDMAADTGGAVDAADYVVWRKNSGQQYNDDDGGLHLVAANSSDDGTHLLYQDILMP